jgi:hypothetical protein
LELELAELVEQRERALVQGRAADAADLQQQIGVLQAELARTAEALAVATDATPSISGAALVPG